MPRHGRGCCATAASGSSMLHGCGVLRLAGLLLALAVSSSASPPRPLWLVEEDSADGHDSHHGRRLANWCITGVTEVAACSSTTTTTTSSTSSTSSTSTSSVTTTTTVTTATATSTTSSTTSSATTITTLTQTETTSTLTTETATSTTISTNTITSLTTTTETTTATGTTSTVTSTWTTLTGTTTTQTTITHTTVTYSTSTASTSTASTSTASTSTASTTTAAGPTTTVSTTSSITTTPLTTTVTWTTMTWSTSTYTSITTETTTTGTTTTPTTTTASTSTVTTTTVTTTTVTTTSYTTETTTTYTTYTQTSTTSTSTTTVSTTTTSTTSVTSTTTSTTSVTSTTTSTTTLSSTSSTTTTITTSLTTTTATTTSTTTTTISTSSTSTTTTTLTTTSTTSTSITATFTTTTASTSTETGTTTTASTSTFTTTTSTTTPLACWLGDDDQFAVPVEGCPIPLLNGASCTASTFNHPCFESGSMTLYCPDEHLILGNQGTRPVIPYWKPDNQVTYDYTSDMGSIYGNQVQFQVKSSLPYSFAVDANGNQKRKPDVLSMAGSFRTKCQVCGIYDVNPVDEDIREGYYEYELWFGPNILNGVMDETDIHGYRVYLVDSCNNKLQKVSYVSADRQNQGHPVNSICDCKSAYYRAKFHFQNLPFSGVTSEYRFSVVPVVYGWKELPYGMVTAPIQDYFTTTYTTTTVTTTSITTSTTTSQSGTTTTGTTTTTTTTTGTTSTTSSTTASTTTTFTSRARLPDKQWLRVSGMSELHMNCNKAADFVKDPKVSTAFAAAFAEIVNLFPERVKTRLESFCRRRLKAGYGSSMGKVLIHYSIFVYDWEKMDDGVPKSYNVHRMLSRPDIASIVEMDVQQQLRRQSADAYDVHVDAMGTTSEEVVDWATQTVPGVPAPTPAPEPEAEPVIESAKSIAGIVAGVIVTCAVGVLCCVASCVVKGRSTSREGQPLQQL